MAVVNANDFSGFGFLIRALFGEDGIQMGGRGSMLQYIRALNAAVRAENRADRRACWEAGHFVTQIGKCIDDPEVGLQKAFQQLQDLQEELA